MLKMLILIKREIYDHLHYFIAALMLSALFIMVSISIAYNFYSEMVPMLIVVFFSVMSLLTIGFTSLGISQMYTDKNRRISAFLSTLPVTRDQILTARIIAGILAILTFYVPLIITTFVLYNLLAPPIPIYEDVLFDISAFFILISIACYCIGLLCGWTPGRFFPSLSGLALACVLVQLVIVKGPGLSISAILILFIIASLIRVRQKFTSTAL
ncbi:MAG: ABC-2 transporter permease [Sedimentisphaerales bacterium]|nr:ABC-2 transporter permease [Sedimentisphaerales bacterium]